MAAAISAMAMPGLVLAFGSDDEWTSGWGQGVAEAIITKGPGNQIYITCDDGAGRNSTGISFMLLGKEPGGSSVLLTFDGGDPEEYSTWNGRIPTNCRACASTYELVIDKLKRHNSVHVRFENGNAARFTLKGAAKAIGQCTPDFYR
jgi:hypothetical protein